MDNNFSKIKVIAWDIDNTLYKRSITLEKEIMSVRNRWLANKINISIIQAGRLIDCEYLKTRNYAKALCYLAKISNESHQKIFAHINKKNHLRKDLRLMRLFKTLKTYRHFINTSAIIVRIRRAFPNNNRFYSQFLSRQNIIFFVITNIYAVREGAW